MRLTLVNRTDSLILYHPSSITSPDKPKLQIALLPSSSTTTDLPKYCTKLTLVRRERLKHDSSSELGETRVKEEAPVNGFDVLVKSLSKARAREVVAVNGEDGRCPWRIYRTKISRKHYKLIVLPRRDLFSFLADVPDTVPISSLLLPGTHDTMSFYGWPISQCQSPLTSNPLLVQLQSGIRALDIRLSIIDGRLISFHGIYPQRSPFTSILDTLYQFLSADEGSSECIVVSIKQEDTASPLFTSLVHSEIAASPGGNDIWFTESNRIPTLGEVRGKCVLLSRFGELGGEALGIHPDRWPDSQKDGFEWNCGETLVRVSDWYAIPSFLSIPEKVTQATSVLLPTAPSHNQNTLSITFFSASSIPLSLPPMIARGFGWPKWGLGVIGVNERVGRWLLGIFAGDAPNPDARLISRFFNLNTANPKKAQTIRKKGAIDEPRIRGWAYMDFYQDPVESGIIPLLVECNFRGRKLGEEGWI